MKPISETNPIPYIPSPERARYMIRFLKPTPKTKRYTRVTRGSLSRIRAIEYYFNLSEYRIGDTPLATLISSNNFYDLTMHRTYAVTGQVHT